MEVDTQESAQPQDPVPINEMDTSEPNDLAGMFSEGVDPVEIDALVLFIR
jgi:hypothetical protein